MLFIANALASFGAFFANFGSAACFGWWFDEPECPKSLIK